jgi:CRP-like cAMP-binding protein
MSGDGLGRTYANGEIVVRQGDTGDCMFSIQTGTVEVIRESPAGEVRVGVLREGEIFGEMAVFEREVRSATVRALGEARVLTLDKKTFLRRVQEDPSLALNITRALCGRVRRLNAELAALKGGGAAATADAPPR